MTPEPIDLNPDTCSPDAVFVQVEAVAVELTPEVLNRPRYGRPNPRRYLPDDEPPPTDPPAAPK